MNDLCTVCDWPHPADKPHRYRIPCPDGRIGCAVAHYGPVDPNAVRAARDAVVEAAVRRRIAERAFRGGADPIGRWRAWKDAEVAEDAAVDRLLALEPRRQG